MLLRFIGVILVFLSVTSCCKTKECRCDLDEAYVNPNAQKWIEPLASQSLDFGVFNGGTDKVNSKYFQYFYCIGEGDCCTDYPYLTLDYTTDSLGLKLFHITALQDEVTFSTEDGGKLGSLLVTTQKLTPAGDMEISHTNAVYAGKSVEVIRIENQNKRPGVEFLTLDYIQAVGVISYMTLDSVIWRRK